jgi:hypothetical protein
MPRGKLDLYNTTVREIDDGKTEVIYYKTAIVTFDEGTIELNTGGYWTRSTKVRMNQVSWFFKLGYTVFQEKETWYVEYLGQKRPFSSTRLVIDREKGVIT